MPHIEPEFASEFNYGVVTHVVNVPQKRKVVCKTNTPILLECMLAVTESRAALVKPQPPVQWVPRHLSPKVPEGKAGGALS